MRWSCVRAIGFLVAVSLVVFVVANQLGDDRGIDAYEVLDEDTILIHTSEGVSSWTRVTRVVETLETVDITVKSFQPPGTYPAIAYPAFFVVDLEAPLGERRVLDGPAEVPRAP